MEQALSVIKEKLQIKLSQASNEKISVVQQLERQKSQNDVISKMQKWILIALKNKLAESQKEVEIKAATLT